MLRAVTATCVVAVLLAACGGDDDAAGPTTNASSTTRGTTAPSTTGATSTAPATPPTTTAVPRLDEVRLTLVEVASGLDSPVAIAFRAGDEAMYVAEQAGRVLAVTGGTVADEVVLDVSDDLSGANEQGLLGIAFSPDGDRLYVNRTDGAGDTRVEEYALRGRVADPGSRRELLFVDQPFRNHNGGHVVFGPDGLLYVGLGDGGSGGDPQGNAQDPGTVLGKIVRLDPAAPSPTPEIVMSGLRNPWRFSFDRATGDVWIGDVGQDAWEEVDFAPAGALGINWGWNLREGTHEYAGDRPPGARDPVYEYSHADGGVAVTGGFVYHGRAIPALAGAYVFADHEIGDLWALVQRDGVLVEHRDLGVHVDAVTTFGEDANGELYVASRDGEVYRLDPG